MVSDGRLKLNLDPAAFLYRRSHSLEQMDLIKCSMDLFAQSPRADLSAWPRSLSYIYREAVTEPSPGFSLRARPTSDSPVRAGDRARKARTEESNQKKGAR